MKRDIRWICSVAYDHSSRREKIANMGYGATEEGLACFTATIWGPHDTAYFKFSPSMTFKEAKDEVERMYCECFDKALPDPPEESEA